MLQAMRAFMAQVHSLLWADRRAAAAAAAAAGTAAAATAQAATAAAAAPAWGAELEASLEQDSACPWWLLPVALSGISWHLLDLLLWLAPSQGELSRGAV